LPRRVTTKRQREARYMLSSQRSTCLSHARTWLAALTAKGQLNCDSGMANSAYAPSVRAGVALCSATELQ